jgi:hypothetical protein
MKRQLLILASLALAPLAFGQTTQTTDKATGPSTYQNADPYKTGTVTAYDAGKSILMNSNTQTHPVKYVVAPTVRYDKKGGGTITPELIRQGTRVELGFDAEGQVNHITLIDLE